MQIANVGEIHFEKTVKRSNIMNECPFALFVYCTASSDAFTTMFDLRSIRIVNVNWSSKLKVLCSRMSEFSGADAHGRHRSIRRKGRGGDENDARLHTEVLCD